MALIFILSWFTSKASGGTVIAILIILYLAFVTIPEIFRSIIRHRLENRKYRAILQEAMPKIQNVNLELYQEKLINLESTYDKIFRSYKIVLKDKKGDAINICPKCGGYMKIVKNWRGKFLGCSNYPNCSSSKDYNKIFTMEI